MGYRACRDYDDTLSRFDRTPERDGQTDGQTDRFAISISRVTRQCFHISITRPETYGDISFWRHMFLCFLAILHEIFRVDAVGWTTIPG